MSISYAPMEAKIPEGFATLLEDLTKQVLARQPKDIIAFCAGYLQRKVNSVSHGIKGITLFC